MKRKLFPPFGGAPIPESRRLMIILAANTVFFVALYYLLPRLGFIYLPFIYLAVGAGVGIWYVLYNRGFNTRGKTPEMLSDEIPLAEREAMIAEGKQRLRKSRWALTVILPIIVTFLIDMIYLYLIPEGLFS